IRYLYPARHTVSRLGERQVERKARATAVGGIDPEAPAHRRHEAAGDEEAQPRASWTARRLGAVELREDVLALAFGDPVAFVEHAHFDAAAPAMGLDGHRSP